MMRKRVLIESFSINVSFLVQDEWLNAFINLSRKKFAADIHSYHVERLGFQPTSRDPNLDCAMQSMCLESRAHFWEEMEFGSYASNSLDG